MNKEVEYLIKQLQEAYEGQPWYGRAIKPMLSEIKPATALQKPNGQHSILELLYHMINWREFTISRMQPGNDRNSEYFDQNDWRQLDHSDESLWEKGLQLLENTQQLLIRLINTLNEEVLDKQVAERDYDYRYLLHGIIQHDIYHLGQIAYVKKQLS